MLKMLSAIFHVEKIFSLTISHFDGFEPKSQNFLQKDRATKKAPGRNVPGTGFFDSKESD
jgi:hypothetical protein